MPLLFKPIQDPIKSKDGKKKWRPTLVRFNHVITTKEVSEKLAEMSSLTPGDTYNMLRNLTTVLNNYLLNSFSVNLEGFGRFSVIAKSRGNGVDSPDDVKPSQITNLRVQFSPTATRTPGGGLTRALFNGVKYERYGSQSNLSTTENNDDDSAGGDDGGGDDWQDPDA